MEKKTIGKFISVLRRANGMTQKELGEKLFVSDKTVSRWERDECTPELSLIPAIAEIFGITTDELLRGERNSPTDGPEDAAASVKQKNKSDRQFHAMLHKNQTRFRNVSLISLGIGVLGLIGALICNQGFTRGLIGFCVAAVFLVAAVIVQLCVTVSAMLHPEEEDEYETEMRQANAAAVRAAVKGIGALLTMLAFTLPLAVLTPDGYTGLSFGSWLASGCLFAGGTAVAFYIVYILFVRKALIHRGLLFADAERLQRQNREKKLLKRMIIIGAAIALVLLCAMGVVSSLGAEPFAEPAIFDNYEDFTAYMEQLADMEQYGYGFGDSFAVNVEEAAMPGEGEDLTDYYPVETLTDAEGNVLCQYIDAGYSSIHFSFDTSEDGLPIRVYSFESMRRGSAVLNNIQAVLWCLMVLDVIACSVVYAVLLRRDRKNGMV